MLQPGSPRIFEQKRASHVKRSRVKMRLPSYGMQGDESRQFRQDLLWCRFRLASRRQQPALMLVQPAI